jgi:transcriptional regulator with PAS, ATPase and Fis domain
MEAQVTLLRVLQDGEYFRVGSTRLMHADIRLIAATNKNLWDEIEKGHFRRDLFYRLNVNTLSLPPLREREGDIPLLAYHFMKLYCSREEKRITRINDEVLDLLKSYDFPGNIRELQNVLQSAVIMEQAETLTMLSLPADFLNQAGRGVYRSASAEVNAPGLLSLQAVEKSHIRRVLEMTGGNRTRAAKLLDISRVTLLAKLKKYAVT